MITDIQAGSDFFSIRIRIEPFSNTDPDPTFLKYGTGSARSNSEESRQQLGLLQVAWVVSNLLADLLELLERVVRVVGLTTHWSWGCIHLKDTLTKISES